MVEVFSGSTANEVWTKALEMLLESEKAQTQGSRAGETREIMGAVFSIDSPASKWVINRDPPLNLAFALAEVVWILAGNNDSAFLNFWNSQLPKFAGKGEFYYGAYGERLRKRFDIDQLEKAYEALKSNPDSRQVVLQIWDPKSDLPEINGSPRAPDIPCNIVSMIKIRGGKLEWTQIMRSNDIFLGTPHNFVQYMSLHEIMAGWLGVHAGEYRHFSDSLHLYESAKEKGFSFSKRQMPKATDSLALAKSEFEKTFTVLTSAAYALITENISKSEFVSLTKRTALPQAYMNIFMILAAYSARKRKWNEVADSLLKQNTNAQYKYMWERRISFQQSKNIKG